MKSIRSADRFFDSYAAGFDSIYGGKATWTNRMISRLFRGSMRKRFELSIAGSQPIRQKTVLDIGCGPGHYGITMATQGASRVVGIDFAPEMLELARKHALDAGVNDRCEFIQVDFMKYLPGQKFDYSIVMGVMDYISAPREFIDHVLGLTGDRAFFSFPSTQHWLALQRKIRYKFKCDLYLYSERKVKELFDMVAPGRFAIQDLGRDYFVSVRMK